jgi:signal transduction histidine kinase
MTTPNLASRWRPLRRALELTAYGLVGIVLFVAAAASLLLVLVWIGLPLVLACAGLIRPLADAHRRIAADVLGDPIPSAYLEVTETGFVARPMAVARDPSVWRDLVWLGVNSTVGVVLAVCAVVEALLGLALWWLPESYLLRWDCTIIRSMLAPDDRARLAARVQALARSRAETVDTQAAELRRIERDLHDGAQARLVSVAMALGLAEERLRDDPEAARALIAEARSGTSEALAEMRDLVRGIHPPVLADRGLVGALEALALTSPVPVEIDAQLETAPSEPVESAAYFAAAEALANAIKHAGASQVAIALRSAGGVLTLRVTDDGRGGADPDAGTGLRGVERRLAAFDGTLRVTSPPGGPTVLTMELPCVSS